jgi:hypothetical protein
MLPIKHIISLLGLIYFSNADINSNFQVNIYENRSGCDITDHIIIAEGPYIAGSVACFAYGGNSFNIMVNGKNSNF